MRKTLLSLLLLTPILALAQELPDENWVCTSKKAYIHLLTNRIIADGPLDNETYIFNPSKGWRNIRNESFEEDVECTGLGRPGLAYGCINQSLSGISDFYMYIFKEPPAEFTRRYPAGAGTGTRSFIGTCTKV